MICTVSSLLHIGGNSILADTTFLALTTLVCVLRQIHEAAARLLVLTATRVLNSGNYKMCHVHCGAMPVPNSK